MPILINKETGLPENVPASAVQDGTHDVPVAAPDGKMFAVPGNEVQEYLQQGYTPPNSEQFKYLERKGKYSTTEQGLKAGAEALIGDTTFGLGTSALQNLGITKAEDTAGRAEFNPGMRTLGSAAGLVGSLATGVGEAALLEKAGIAGAAKLGLKAEQAGADAVKLGLEAGMSAKEAASLAKVAKSSFSAPERLGSMAVRGAIENGLYQVGSEVDKYAYGNPDSVESALAHVGLASALGGGIGGGLGALGEAWSKTDGLKLSELMSTIKNRAEGMPVELKEKAGIYIPPNLEAPLSGSRYGEKLLNDLRESASSAGKSVQEDLSLLNSNIKNAAAETLGHDEASIASLGYKSDYEAGKALKDELLTKFKAIVNPVKENYAKFTEQFKDMPLNPNALSELANNISAKASEMGLDKSGVSAQMNSINELLAALPKQETVQDLRNLIKNQREAHKGPDSAYIGRIIVDAISDTQRKAVEDAIAEKAPQLLSEYAMTNKQYSEVKTLIEDLSKKLSSGKAHGPETFIDNLEELAPEKVLSRLSPSGNMEFAQVLQTQFPDLAQRVRQIELDKLIRKSSKDGELNFSHLIKNLDRMGEDLRNFTLNSEQLQRLDALKQISERVPKRGAFESRISDGIFSKTINSAAAWGAMLLGKHPAMDYILTRAGLHIGKEASDGVKLAMLKFLSSSSEISAEGFASAAKMASAIEKGEKAMTQSVKSIFGTGGKVIPFPSARDIEKLERQVQKVADNDVDQQKEMIEAGGATGHYMPDHAAALSMAVTRNLQYLASLKPQTKAVSPLDSDPVPNSEQLAKYQRALQIAEQPLIVAQAIKNGSVTAADLTHLRTMYPALYQRMSQKMMEELINKPKVPYATKMGISSFMGQPLDSSLLPTTIQSTQQAFVPTMPAAQGPQRAPSAASMKGLEKMPGLNMSGSQSRQLHRNRSH